uniref:Uncharacterized protein n=1 Tax=Fagus sylvatica TaxID=28930 RepID=A0A2N9G007_FAGSY
MCWRHERLPIACCDSLLLLKLLAKVNVNNACVAEETLIFEISEGTDMSSIPGTEMSATEEFPATEEITAAGIIPAVEVPEVEHMGSEVEVIPSTEIEDDIPDIEGTFAQDPNDNAPLEDMDMADVHDSYDAVLADVQEEQCPRLQFLNWRLQVLP